MHIAYDRSIPIGTLGPTPWSGNGLHKWFDNFTCVTIHGWGGSLEDVPHTVSLAPDLAEGRFLLEDAFELREFYNLIKQARPPCPLLTWHLEDLPSELEGLGYRAVARNPKDSERFENKAWVRRQFGDQMTFPDFVIYKFVDLKADEKIYNKIAAGRKVFVLQHSSSNGSRGTFIVHDFAEFSSALASLAGLEDRPEEVVISDFIRNARDRSVQCVVSGQGVYVGPLQKQIIGDPQLVNLKEVERPKFGGGEIDPNDSLINIYPKIKAYAEVISRGMQSMGYRGIVGVDCLVGPDSEVYVLEVNPRSTGLTPLLTHLWRDENDFPAYLIHVLENCRIPYTITDSHLTHTTVGAMLQLHSQLDYEWHISEQLRPGVYKWDSTAKKVVFVEAKSKLSAIPDDSHFLVETTYPHAFSIRPGRRLIKLFFNHSVLDAQDKLLPEYREIVVAMYELALPTQ